MRENQVNLCCAAWPGITCIATEKGPPADEHCAPEHAQGDYFSDGLRYEGEWRSGRRFGYAK
jgi:hypothetical protein